MSYQSREFRPGYVIGLDFGLTAPGEEFSYISVGFGHRDGRVTHCFDSLFDPACELDVGEGEVVGTSGLKRWILGRSDEEHMNGFIHR